MFKRKSDISISRKLYTNILISLTVFITTTIFILSYILYLNFENISLRITNIFIKDSLNQISYSTKYLCDLSKSLSLQIYFNKDISKLSYYYPPDLRETSLATSQLRSYRNTSPFIHSIYIYTKIRDTLYTSLPMFENIPPQKKASFSDQDIYNILKERKKYRRLIPIPRSVPYTYPNLSSKSPSNIYTFLFFESSEESNELDDLIVILNVSEDWLRKTISNLDTQPQSNTFIIDRKGKMVISDKSHPILTDVSNEPYIKTILSSKNDSGYFVSKSSDENTKSVVTYMYSSSLDWIFVRTVPYNSVMEKIQDMKGKTFLIGSIILIGGLLCSFVISSRLYIPMRSIVSKLTSVQTENQNIQKQNVLKNILLNVKGIDMDGIQKSFSDLSININTYSEFLIILFKIDHFKCFCDENSINDRAILKFEYMNIAYKKCSSSFSCEAADVSDDHFVLICNVYMADLSNLQNEITELIKNIQDDVTKHYSISLSAAVSQISTIFTEISHLYYDALNISNYRLIYGYSCIIFSNDIKELTDRQYTYPTEKGKLLIDSLVLGNTSKAKELYLQIVNSTINHTYSIIKSTLLHLAVDVNIAIEKIQINLDCLMPNNLSSFIFELDSIETLDEINNYFFSLFETITPKLDKKIISKHDILINNVIEAINTNYKDQNLSLDSLADTVNVSPVYLGRLFKRMKSISISDYINKVRVERAKELLVNTDYSINEIVDQIGYINRGNFYPIFKKACAMTPNEYRQKNNSLAKGNNC